MLVAYEYTKYSMSIVKEQHCYVPIISKTAVFAAERVDT